MRADLREGAHDPLPPARAGAPYDIVFLDRDGTLNVRVEGGWVCRPDELVLIEGAGAAVAQLNACGARVVVVTNQRGLATGAITPTAWAQIGARLQGELAKDAAHLDAVAVCPHQPGACGCRKPAPGLLREILAAAPWADPMRCLLIGDTRSDEDAARTAGVPAVRVDERVGLADAVPDVLDRPHR